MTDNDVIEKLKNKKQIKWFLLDKFEPNIYKYLLNRYNDSESIQESYYRILNNIEIRPICPICGGKLQFYKKTFRSTCINKKCKINWLHIKAQQTFIKKYGVKSPFANIDIQNKIKQKNKEKYGEEYLFNSKEIQDKIKNAHKEKYGNECISKNEIIKQKQKETNIKKYGYSSPLQNDIIKEKSKQTLINIYGADNIRKTQYMFNKCHTDKANEKRYNTLKQNNSFSRSKNEDYCYKELCKIFKEVKRQYKSKDYPFNCDFYIPEINTYIEYQGSHYHHYHPFNINDINDIKELNKLIEKDKLSIRTKHGKKSQYKQIIYVWTELDVKKRNIAKLNKLNFIEFWNINEFNKWINDISNVTW